MEHWRGRICQGARGDRGGGLARAGGADSPSQPGLSRGQCRLGGEGSGAVGGGRSLGGGIKGSGWGRVLARYNQIVVGSGAKRAKPEMASGRQALASRNLNKGGGRTRQT